MIPTHFALLTEAIVFLSPVTSLASLHIAALAPFSLPLLTQPANVAEEPLKIPLFESYSIPAQPVCPVPSSTSYSNIIPSTTTCPSHLKLHSPSIFYPARFLMPHGFRLYTWTSLSTTCSVTPWDHRLSPILTTHESVLSLASSISTRTNGCRSPWLSLTMAVAPVCDNSNSHTTRTISDV